jgi:hypothetical protein
MRLQVAGRGFGLWYRGRTPESTAALLGLELFETRGITSWDREVVGSLKLGVKSFPIRAESLGRTRQLSALRH